MLVYLEEKGAKLVPLFCLRNILSRLGVTYRRVLDWMIGFIAPYTFTQFGTTGQYSAIAILHTFQFAVAHAVGFTVFTSRILPTDFHTVPLPLQITPEVFFAPPNSFLAISAAANSEDSTRLLRFKTTVLY
jgi:hypothetical protein